MKKFFLLLFCSSLIVTMGFTQENIAIYKKAEDYPAKIKDKVYHAPNSIQWIGSTYEFWYMQLTAKGRQFIKVNAATLQKGAAFEHERVAAALQQATNRNISADSLPFSTFNYVKNGTAIEFSAFKKNWEVDIENYTVTDKGNVLPTPKNEYWNNRRDDSFGEPVFSPDRNTVAFLKNNNIYIHPSGKPAEAVQLTFDGSPNEYYSNNMRWSPDSKKLIGQKVKKVTVRTINFVESSPTEQLQPILHTRNYPKPGDALPQYQPVLFNLSNQSVFAVDEKLILNQYSLSAIQWHKNSNSFTFEYNQRGHQQYIVYKMDAVTGAVTPLIDERSKTFIDYSGKKYKNNLDNEVIWTSERDGWNHLYLYDYETGNLKNQITSDNWVVRKVIEVNENTRTIIFEGSGREAAQDPYLIQYYMVNFDGTGLKALTNENAQHKGSFSKDFKYFVDCYSRIDMPQVTVLRETATGKILMELEKADITALQKTDWRPTEVFSAKGRDGVTDIWGIITRPTHFNPTKKYPVIEYIYAGPHNSFVPKNFSPNPSALGELAELGFIVVQIDGMGTSNRSKAFHDVCWQNLKDAGFPDRIAWLKAAAAKYPYMDLNRVGIYGTSAGGQSAAGGLLFHPDFYKVGVASCGCHDNRIDKMWWNEQWMGYPIGPQYTSSSNIDNAYRLQGKLMLILGEVDDNVDPAATYQLVNALIKANKDHEFVLIPGMGHSSGGNYGEQKRRDFFVQHLLGETPPGWTKKE